MVEMKDGTKMSLEEIRSKGLGEEIGPESDYDTFIKYSSDIAMNETKQAQQKIGELNIDIAQMEKRIISKRALDDNLKKEIEVLDKRDAELKKEIEVLDKRDAELKKEIEVLDKRDAELKKEIEVLDKRNTEMSKALVH